jgi:CubicO group peptidase (beta-lactamase class C family)
MKYLAFGFLLLNGSLAAAPAVDLDAALKQWLAGQPGGLAAAYIDAGGVTFANAGRFDAADARAITPDTQFEIGSVSKVFTALLLADAVSVGKVSLDAPVGAPFPASSVSYLQLATHTSGLPRMPADFTSSDPRNPYVDETLPVLVKSFAAAAPGLKPAPSAYSNFGFAVLGQAVAGAWGKTYAEALAERVLVPLGLGDTRLSWRDAGPARLAPGHDETGAPVNWDLNAFAPAGAIVSTTRDLAKLVQAGLGLTPTALSAVLADTMKPRVPGDNAARQVGLAWQVEQRGVTTLIWHNGQTGGYHSFVVMDTAAKTGLVLLTNHSRGLEPLGFALLAGRMPPAARAAVNPADSAKEFLGNYPLAPSFVMAVTAEGEQLFLQATNQPRLKLNRLAADRYGVQGVDAEVSFERDAAGKIAALTLHQNGMNQRAPWSAPGAKPAGPKEIALPAEELAAYVGHYKLGPAEFTVTRDDAKLLVQLTGQPKVPVFASAKDEFFYKVVNAQLSFVREDGKVVALILHQNGRDQRATKAD